MPNFQHLPQLSFLCPVKISSNNVLMFTIFFAHRVLKCDTLEIFVGKILCVTKAAYGKPTHLPKHLPEKGNKEVPPGVSQN